MRKAGLVAAQVAVAAASSAAAAPATPYRPRLVVSTGQPVRTGESRFSFLTDFRRPATADVDLYVPPGAADAACDSAAHSAVWTATLTNATSSFSFTIFVRRLANPTAPSVPQPTELHWCLPKSAPRLSTLAFDLDGVLAQPARGSLLWDARLTPYDPATGAVVAGAQVSSLVLVRLRQVVRLAARRSGADSTGRFTVTERLAVWRPVRFKAHATAGFRDRSKPTCGTDANGVPCVSKSLAVWEQDSNLVTVVP